MNIFLVLLLFALTAPRIPADEASSFIENTSSDAGDFFTGTSNDAGAGISDVANDAGGFFSETVPDALTSTVGIASMAAAGVAAALQSQDQKGAFSSAAAGRRRAGHGRDA